MVEDGFAYPPPTGNVLAGEKGEESQFEGIAYVPANDTFLLLHEVWSLEILPCYLYPCQLTPPRS